MALLFKQFFSILLKDKLPLTKLLNYVKPWFFKGQAPNIAQTDFYLKLRILIIDLFLRN